ncbi:Protein FAR1-RELATED SEQUENCE 6 [Bienertia sinuspersici]
MSSNGQGCVGVDANVIGDVGCTPTKECSDVVALVPPTVGMVFSSWQEVETYYKAYAKQQGFGMVRAAWSGYKAKDKTRKPRNAQWTCDRLDKPDRRRKVNGKRCVIDSQIKEDSGVKTSKKCECPVQIYASVNAENDNYWVVRKVVNEHQNHTPTPSKSRSIVAHRKEEMNCHVKRKLKLGHSAGLKVAQIHNMLVRERNGLQEMAINERDIRNELYREKKLKLKDGDAKAMLEQYDAHSETFIRQIACGFPCESVFQRCYTYMKFKEIQRECNRIMFLHYFQNVVTSDNVTKYTFAHRVWCRNKETKKEYLTQYKRNYRVCFNMISKLAECGCSLFNHSGIICRHMIKLYDILGEEVPDRYILRRWRKGVSRKHMRVKVAYHDPSKTEHVVSYDEMQLAFELICSKASVFKDTKQLVLEFLELLNIRDKQVGTPASTTAKRKADCGIPTLESDKLPSSAGNEGNVMDPPRKAKPAHRTPDHRYYSAVQKAIKVMPQQKTKETVSKGTSHLIDVNQGAIVSDIPMF